MKRIAYIAAVTLALTVSAVRADYDIWASCRYRGASVDVMTERVVPVVERGLRTVKGVRSVKLIIRPQSLLTVATVRGDGSDRRLVRLDMESRFRSLVPELPSEVTDIVVTDPGVESFPYICSVSGRGTSMRELKLRARALMDEMLRLPDVDDIRLLGEEEENVVLSLPKDEFLLNCSVDSLGDMIKGVYDIVPAGNLAIGSMFLRIHSPTINHGPDDILDLPYTVFPVDGSDPTTVMLRDHMKVSLERTSRPPMSMAGLNGERCVLVAVSFSSRGSDAELDRLVEQERAKAPLGINIEMVHDLRGHENELKSMLFDAYLREGVTVAAMDGSARSFAASVKGIPLVRNVLTVSGIHDLAFVEGMKVEPHSANHATLIVALDADADAAEVSRRIAALSRERSDGLVVCPRTADQPGFGITVEHTLTSKDPVELESISERMLDAARKHSGVSCAMRNWGEQIEGLKFELYESRARQLALTPGDISQACQMSIEGVPVACCWSRGDHLPIVLRLDRKDISNPQDLEQLWVYSPAFNRCVPFSQIVKEFKSIAEPGTRIRNNGRYEMRLRAYAADAKTADLVRSEWNTMAKGK